MTESEGGQLAMLQMLREERHLQSAYEPRWK